MNANSVVRPNAENECEALNSRKAPPSAVLSFAAPIEAGKTTVSTLLSQRLGAPRVSFGDYLRLEAQARHLQVTREVLQDLGERLVSQDVVGFCEEVLKQQPWEAGRPLIIDGVRHVEVLDALGQILAPAEEYLIYINVDRTTQSKRLMHDSLPHKKTLNQLELHPTEVQVRTKLPDKAALVLDGTRAADELAQKVIDFLDSKGEDGRERGWDEKNSRRIQLAEKKSRGELEAPELAEFDQLQTQYFDYLDSKFPRTPVDPDRLAEIERRLKGSGGG